MHSQLLRQSRYTFRQIILPLAIQQILNMKLMSIVNIFNLTKKLADLKKIFFSKYSTAIKTKQFLTQPDGTLKVTPGEGFVAVDKSGNMVKLVDRLEFSRANFAISREEKFK